ncbi:M50 family metallopeptidase [uncultured Erythrobacter sp.]|uniref:M50 family metallopeptidase n=1 Tax=uncultured Erythrobacter sp. TaxID=263913 RepID=UPI002627D98D|nr:M50 family metallopeptidase [uncultured Erythrobacter sp.]
MRSIVVPGSQAEQVGRLLIAVFVVIALPALPLGNYISYPFVILTTWFHEMGHGLAALATGQPFDQLQIFSDGSGVARSAVASDASAFTRAAIAAGGPLGPVLVGAALILASARERFWRPALWITAGAIIASVGVYVRSPVGLVVLPFVAGFLGLVAWKAPAGAARFLLQFLGMLGALSMLRDFDYLFTEEAVIAGERMLSDTGQIEASLLLPHWFWATAILALSAVIVGASLKYALAERPNLPRGPKPPANVLQFKRTTDSRDR